MDNICRTGLLYVILVIKMQIFIQFILKNLVVYNIISINKTNNHY